MNAFAAKEVGEQGFYLCLIGYVATMGRGIAPIRGNLTTSCCRAFFLQIQNANGGAVCGKT
jgi:hypothetical protein